MGDGARGLFAAWRLLELLFARSGAVARVPLGRGWDPGHHRSRMPVVLRGGDVEWAGSDYQGKTFWSHWARGEPWRGCKGVLLLPRLHANAFVHEGAVQVSAA